MEAIMGGAGVAIDERVLSWDFNRDVRLVWRPFPSTESAANAFVKLTWGLSGETCC